MTPESPNQDLLPGYKIHEMIFDKGTTRVYRAERLSDGRSVMLKALRDDGDILDSTASLKHEYDIARQFNADGVIQVIGLEQFQNRPMIVLEDFGGVSLSRLIESNKTISLPELLSIAIQLSQGLSDIHGANIIHKDITPSNVVYNPDTGKAKVIDFGISTYLTREQAAIANPKVVEASLPYISPEQTGRMNRSVDYRSDFYSFGVTLFELLTGRLPFVVSEPIEWFHCHIAKQPPTPFQIDPTIPQPVSDIVMKLMEKMAENRYQSAQGLKADLQHCLDQLNQSGTIEPFELGTDDISQHFQIPQTLYGREQEVKQLLASFERVSQGSNELMLVSGYSGIGKTCLIREIYKPITERRGFFIAGKYDQLHRNVPYSALVAALRDLVRQLLTENEERLATWREKILAAVGVNGQIMVDLLRELELVIGPQPDVAVLPPLESEQRFHLVFMAFIKVFASAAHPLAIFLDDLQWADNASLNLLESLIHPESKLPYLLVIGAFRDNEVQQGHPLRLSIKSIAEHGCPVEEIRLSPLSLEHLAALLSDTLGLKRDDVMALAQLIQQKTAGNPFFTEEFLKALHQKGLIVFDTRLRCWTGDVDLIRQQQITDNVVDLMAEKLCQLEPQTLELIKLAACIGNRFPLSLLMLVSDQDQAQIEAGIKSAMKAGVIAPIGDTYQIMELKDRKLNEVTVEFAFAHDRIQQSAYALLDKARRKQVHLQIGRLLLRRLNDEKRHERLFDITNSLNFAIKLINDPAERAQLCQLNLLAGKRAKASTAYDSAKSYFNFALGLLPEDSWQQAYELTLELHNEAAEAAYSLADYSALQKLLEAGYAGAKTLIDKIDLYLVQISALIAQGRLQESLDLAKPVIAKLDYHYPDKPNKFQVMIELFKSIIYLRKVDIKKLENLPAMTDPRHIAAHLIGSRIGAPAMFLQPELLSMMAFRSLRIQYKHGHCVHALNAWTLYGMVLASRLYKSGKGDAFGKLALMLTKRFKSRAMAARVEHLYNAVVRHWHEPLRNCIDPLQQAYRLAIENGDFEYAVLALVVRMIDQLDSGLDLDTLQSELREYHGAIKQLRQGDTLDYVDIYLQFCENMSGKVKDPAVLIGEHYDVEAKRNAHEKKGDKSLIVIDHDMTLLTRYLFGDVKGALIEADTMSVDDASVAGFFMSARMTLLDTLIRFANVHGATRKERKNLMRKAAGNQAKMKAWSKNNPDNFRNKYCLIEAERLRVMEKELEAHPWYDEAIRLAAEQGFIHEQALANELCGAMHCAAGRMTIGMPYLAQALELYQRWGALAKVESMQQRYPQLIRAVRYKDSTILGGTTRTEQLVSIDITALMKALKAIAEEKAHGRMVELILASALEFAAAQQGLLILRNAEGKFFIEGEASVDGSKSNILRSLPLTDERLPRSLINYVIRTKASIVVHDAQQAVDDIPGLNVDPYIQKNGIRSLLCLSIVTGSADESELIGLLYLENNLAVGSFIQERFDTLEIIGMAAAGRLELSRKASFDGLTGLFNHEYFQNMLRQEFASSRRYQLGLGLILIDIDHFKQFNDTWGHQVGDLVLREVAQLIKSHCRDCDVVARYGGEEMVIIMPSTTMPYAEEVAERIRAVVENHRVIHEGHELTVTISLGLSMLGENTVDKDELIRVADEALYVSKRNGRNQVTVA